MIHSIRAKDYLKKEKYKNYLLDPYFIDLSSIEYILSIDLKLKRKDTKINFIDKFKVKWDRLDQAFIDN